MSFGKFITALAVVGAVAGGGDIFAEKSHTAAAQAARLEAAKPTAAPAVTVSKVTTNDYVETATVSGSLIPREEILVSPEIEGLRVLELLADEGDHVKKGQVLARLVSEQIDAQIAQNQANLARSIAGIKAAAAEGTAYFADPKNALDQLERQLARFIEIGETSFNAGEDQATLTKRLEAEVADQLPGADPELIARYELATPSYMAAMGLTRYFTKRAASSQQ